MSIKVVHREIQRFLQNPDPEVLCLKGKWGVGKTYAWNYYLNQAAEEGILSLDKYAYVSLFGLKDLEDIKYALFESTHSKEDLKKGPTLNSVQTGIKWVKRNYRKGVALLANIPFIRSSIGESEKSLFFLVRNQIVCIDDLERAGGDLNTKDVFGLISYLKEQRKCKVVLLLNDEKLSKENKSIYNEQLEKVVDTRLDFSPIPQEAADIVFPAPEGIRKLLKKNCIALGITNIRVIKKIERTALRLEEIFGKDSPLIFQTAHSVTLLGWSVYQPNEAPSPDFLKDFSRIHGLIKDKEQISEKEKAWQELLRCYEYSSTDEFDLKILETIQKGYFDTDNLNVIAKKEIGRISETKSKNAFKDAWDLYHYSFDDNENVVLDAIYSSAKSCAKFIEPINIDSTVIFLKDFGRVKEAKDLIKHYIKAHSGEKDILDFERSIFSRDIKDPDLIKAIKKVKKSSQDLRDPAKVLIDIFVNRGWDIEDISLISKLTTNDFYKIFKETKGIQLHQIIKTVLDFGNIGNASVEMKSIAQNAREALQRIGKESRLNARRVAVRGIKIEDDNK